MKTAWYVLVFVFLAGATAVSHVLLTTPQYTIQAYIGIGVVFGAAISLAGEDTVMRRAAVAVVIAATWLVTIPLALSEKYPHGK